MSGNAQVASGGGETFVLARRGLPLAQASAALPRAPWLPAALRSRAQALRRGALPAMPPGPTEADAELDAVTAGADMNPGAAREAALEPIPAATAGEVKPVAEASTPVPPVPPTGAPAASAITSRGLPTAVPRATPDSPAPRRAAAGPGATPPARAAIPTGIDSTPAATPMPAAPVAVASRAAAPGAVPPAAPARVQGGTGTAARDATRTQTAAGVDTGGAMAGDGAHRGEAQREDRRYKEAQHDATQRHNMRRGATRQAQARRGDEAAAGVETRPAPAPRLDAARPPRRWRHVPGRECRRSCFRGGAGDAAAGRAHGLAGAGGNPARSPGIQPGTVAGSRRSGRAAREHRAHRGQRRSAPAGAGQRRRAGGADAHAGAAAGPGAGLSQSLVVLFRAPGLKP